MSDWEFQTTVKSMSKDEMENGTTQEETGNGSRKMDSLRSRKESMGVDLRIYQKRIPKLKAKGAREIGTHL